MSTDDRITAQPPEPESRETSREPLPDFRLPPKRHGPTILFGILLAVLVPTILCSGLLSLPTTNRDYREYLRPMNEFFFKVFLFSVGLGIGLLIGHSVGKANR